MARNIHVPLFRVRLRIDALDLAHREQHFLVVLHARRQIVNELMQLLQCGLLEHGQQRLVVDQPLLNVAVPDGQQSLVRRERRILIDGDRTQLVDALQGVLVGVDVPVQFGFQRDVQRVEGVRVVGGQTVQAESCGWTDEVRAQLKIPREYV